MTLRTAMFGTFCALLLLVPSLHAQRTVRLSLESIVAKAGTAFHGTVLRTVRETDPATSLTVDRITFAVAEDLLGGASGEVTVMMVAGTDARGRRKLSELPRFAPGDEVVAMFHEPSTLGLTSPVGMGQGTFRVTGTAQGKRVTISAAQRERFAARTAAPSDGPQQVPLNDFLAAVRTLAAERKERLQ
ncbi:MAG: hypothetical protein F9K22_07815 [Bacteroidetes bacterium]|nr:MAG: hypothetical protein F9K22_07815 [Bacteroidota bacterium]